MQHPTGLSMPGLMPDGQNIMSLGPQHSHRQQTNPLPPTVFPFLRRASMVDVTLKALLTLI